MARSNRRCAIWVVGLLEIRSNHRVLEVGFGPGVGIQLLAERASAGQVSGVDASAEMVSQASARNAVSLKNRRVELLHGSVDKLPFDDGTFDRALSINSMQVWPDAIAGLSEMRRVLKTGGILALGFTPHSGQSRTGLAETLASAGYSGVRLLEADGNLCVLATKP